MAEKRRIQEPPIRIKSTSRATATRMAEALGVQYTQIVNWAVDALGEYFDAHNGNLLLPLDFRKRFRVFFEEPMILHEAPRAAPKSTSVAGAGRTNKRAQKAIARA